MAKNRLTPKSQDMSKWYTQVIQQAYLADYSPVKGCMVIRPNGYEIWENIQKILDNKIKDLGVRNAYFPVFIPLSLLNKEADHIEGFAPELAVVTHGGGEELVEKLAVRPTSETIMYSMYSKWVQSYRDLPLLLNQWNNAVRWEKRTYFFLRTTEFLWQEAHTAHATHDEALAMVYNGLDAYATLSEDFLAIPVVRGRKSQTERFAGAVLTATIESMMPDGKALQAGTSHDLGQNFSKETAFNIAFQNQKGETDYAWQTSYGLSTRIIGALIMTHGDDDGLVLPPKIAPIQVAIVAAQNSEDVLYECVELSNALLGNSIRVKLMTDPEKSLGWKLNETEMQGIPITLVMGERELKNKTCTAKIRYNKEEQILKIEGCADDVAKLLEEIQAGMFKKALQTRESLTTEVESFAEFNEVMNTKRGFLKAFWCEDEKCEQSVKDETKATTRCLPFIDEAGSVEEASGTCVKCGKPATHRWLFAQSY